MRTQWRRSDGRGVAKIVAAVVGVCTLACSSGTADLKASRGAAERAPRSPSTPSEATLKITDGHYLVTMDMAINGLKLPIPSSHVRMGAFASPVDVCMKCWGDATTGQLTMVDPTGGVSGPYTLPAPDTAMPDCLRFATQGSGRWNFFGACWGPAGTVQKSHLLVDVDSLPVTSTIVDGAVIETDEYKNRFVGPELLPVDAATAVAEAAGSHPTAPVGGSGHDAPPAQPPCAANADGSMSLHLKVDGVEQANTIVDIPGGADVDVDLVCAGDAAHAGKLANNLSADAVVLGTSAHQHIGGPAQSGRSSVHLWSACWDGSGTAIKCDAEVHWHP